MQVAPTTVPKTYDELLRGVQDVLRTGRGDIEVAWVRTYHEIGRMINEHILHFAPRADYGAKLFVRLAADSGISKRSLHECAQFHRCFPIVRHVAQLGWNRCRLLCQVDDAPRRNALAAQAVKNDWASGKIVRRVRALNATLELEPGAAPARPAIETLTPKRGIVGRYRVVASAGAFGTAGEQGLCVDVGFKLYLPLPPASARHRTAGDIVRVGADGGLAAVSAGRPADLFTYDVTVRRVIDGDTLEIAIALPHFVLRVKLRLRGLDCPEIDTPEGKVAKRVVESLVRGAKSVTVYSSKPDKYDRYLADVFIVTADGTEVFLNNHLLENGFAERKDAWDFGDWEKLEVR